MQADSANKLVTEILHLTLSLTGNAHFVIEILHITINWQGILNNVTEMLHVITDN